MKKLVAFLLVLLVAVAAFAGTELLPIIDAGLSEAIATTNTAYATVTTNYTSAAAGQLLVGTDTNLTRTVWISVQAGSTTWHKIAP